MKNYFRIKSKLITFLICLMCVANGLFLSGLISIEKTNALSLKEEFSTIQTIQIPASFNSDPYNQAEYITSVKNQGEFGMCWSYAVCSTAEADAIKNYGADKNTTDFSEWHLAYFTFNGERKGTGDKVYTDPSGLKYYDNGSTDEMTYLSLATGIGLVDEASAPVSDLVKDKNKTLPEEMMYEDSGFKLRNAEVFYLPKMQSDVKKAIMDHGAVTMCYDVSNSVVNNLTGASYCKKETPVPDAYFGSENFIDHEICVVGWDDNYSVNNFAYSARPQNNGAWLVKNSWGTDVGQNGFFWISYEDKSVTRAVSYTVMPSDTYDNLYQHDGGIFFNGTIDNYMYLKTPCANIFESKGEEKLTAVGVATNEYHKDEVSNDSQPYELRIYKNPDPFAYNLVLGDLVYTQKGNFGMTGYTIINLDKPVTLKKNEKFVVWMDTPALICLDKTINYVSELGGNVHSDVSSLKGQSFISTGGLENTNYYDCAADDVENKYNIRLKAYTKNVVIGQATISEKPLLKEIFHGQELSFSSLSGGKITDSISGEIISGKWQITDDLNLRPADGNMINVKFIPDNKVYKEVKTAVPICVKKTNPQILLSDIEDKCAIGEEIIFLVKRINPYAPELRDIGQVVCSYQINDGEIIPIENNKFNVPENLNKGSVIKIFAVIEESEKYNRAEVVKTVDLSFESFIHDKPIAKSISYGQDLHSSAVDYGLVFNMRKEPVAGTWKFKDINSPISTTREVDVVFTPINENYSVLETQIILPVNPVTTEIKLVTDKTSYKIGETIFIETGIKNTFKESLTDYGNIRLSYRIEQGGVTKHLSDNKLIIPDNAEGATIYIVAETEKIEGKYIVTSKTISVEVEKKATEELPETPDEEKPTKFPVVLTVSIGVVLGISIITLLVIGISKLKKLK